MMHKDNKKHYIQALLTFFLQHFQKKSHFFQETPQKTRKNPHFNKITANSTTDKAKNYTLLIKISNTQNHRNVSSYNTNKKKTSSGCKTIPQPQLQNCKQATEERAKKRLEMVNFSYKTTRIKKNSRDTISIHSRTRKEIIIKKNCLLNRKSYLCE